MSANGATTNNNGHTCSCGRTFANEQILKYHQRVSKHTAGAAAVVAVATPVAAVAAPVVEVAGPDLAELAYRQAIETLNAKRAEQEAYERNLATARVVNEFVDFAGELATEGCKVGARAVSSSLVAGRQLAAKLMFVLLVVLMTAGLVTAGMGLGTVVASASGTGVAQAVSPAGVVASI